MTDDENKYMSSLRDVSEGQEIRHMLCHYHIRNAWIRKLNVTAKKHADPSVKGWILRQLDALLREKDSHTFNELCRSFMSGVGTVDSAFADYFERNYLGRVEEWAMCMRRFPHSCTDTNNHTESFHRKLKNTFLERKTHIRIDRLVESLLEKERVQFLELKRHLAFNLPPRIREVESESAARHNRSKSIDDRDVMQAGQSVWKVKSQRCADYYDVVSCEDVHIPCTRDLCFYRCATAECANLCEHKFNCTCKDIHPLCKHIHKVYCIMAPEVQQKSKCDIAPAVAMHHNPDVDVECPQNSSEADGWKAGAKDALRKLSRQMENPVVAKKCHDTWLSQSASL